MKENVCEKIKSVFNGIKLHIRIVCTILLVMSLFGVLPTMIKMKDTYTDEEKGIAYESLTTLIRDNTDIRQGFTVNKTMRGIRLRMATYGTELTGRYCVLLYNQQGILLDQKEISGKDIVDTSYTDIRFSKTYEPGTYSFGVRALDSTEELLSVWKSSSDTYTDGALIINGILENGDLDFDVIVSGPNTKLLAAIIIGVLFILLLELIWQGQLKAISKNFNIVIYGCALALSIVMMQFAWMNLHLELYDETAHLSYLADLTEEFKIMPDYENQHLLVRLDHQSVEGQADLVPLSQSFGFYQGKFSETVNYLGHPPLYYWLMLPLRAVDVTDGMVTANLNVLRAFNVILVLCGVALFLYIGYTRIDSSKRALHFLYSMVIAAFPMLYACGPTFNNDNLSFVLAAIFFLGMLRFLEEKKNAATYFLIAIGICGAALTKMTVCIMLAICALFIVGVQWWKTKKITEVFNGYFLLTLPLYLLVVVYYLTLYSRYGTFQVSLMGLVGEEAFKTYSTVYVDPANRVTKTFPEFTLWFFKRFITQWSAGTTWKSIVPDNVLGITRIAFNVLWLTPFVVWFKRRKKDDNSQVSTVLKGFALALIVTVLIQFVRGIKDFYFISGYAGIQSRYYVCVMPVMVFIICHVLHSKKMILNKICDGLAVILGVLAVYGGVLFYLFNTSNFY